MTDLPNPVASMLGLAIFGLSLPVAVFAGVDEDLAKAAKSPYEIARFVDTHVTFDWEPLWKALGIPKDQVFIQPCGTMSGPKRDCSEELITVLDPFQVILILRHDLAEPEVYLRFLRPSGPDGSGPWKFGGYYAPYVKYFEPRHRPLRFGRKSFFLVTRQGASGSGLSSEVEDWVDLSSPKFEPVFSLTTQGHDSGMPDRIGIETIATVVSMETDPAASLKVAYDIRFTHNGEVLGGRSDTAVYVRHGGSFSFDAGRSKTPEADIENLYNIGDDHPSNEDYLRYLLVDLKKIATGPAGEQKDWLKRFLMECGDTAEKRELQALLTKSPSN
jgi:hypothetical protein